MKYLILIISYFIVSPVFADVLIINKKNTSSYYVNHDHELKLLKEKLSKNNKVGIVGLPGKGKTELMKRYIDKNKEDYDIIAVINADIDIIPQYIDIAKSLNTYIKENIISVTPNKVEEELLQYFSKRKRWLIVYDNLKINNRHIIKEIMKWDVDGHIIITSQDSRYIPSKVDLSFLDKNNAKQLISNIAMQHGVEDNVFSEEIIKKIIDNSKGYPYLISKISMFIANYRHKNVYEVVDYINESDNVLKGFMDVVYQNINQTSKQLLTCIAMLNNQEISKNILLSLYGGDNKLLVNDIHELVNVGILEHIGKNVDDQIYQLHDLLKEEILRRKNDVEKTRIVNYVLDKINDMFPDNSLGIRHQLIMQDRSMIGNLEKLLISTKQYNACLYKVMRLRKYIFDYYIGIRDKVNCTKMAEWLYGLDENINIQQMSDVEKGIYSYYLVKVGVYEELLRDNSAKAFKLYNKAKMISDQTSLVIYKFVSRFQLARLQISTGNVSDAQQTMDEILAIDYKNEEKLWYIKAKILFAKGEYKNALPVIQEGITAYAKTGDNNSINYFYLNLMEAEVHNYLKQYLIAKNLANGLYLSNKEHLSDSYIVEARILIQLSKSLCGLMELDNALLYIDKAIHILSSSNKSRINNKDLADAYFVKSEILSNYDNEEDKVIYGYRKSEVLYYDVYRHNIKNMIEIRNLLEKAAKFSCRRGLKNDYRYFKGKLIKYFGKMNDSAIDVQQYCQQIEKN